MCMKKFFLGFWAGALCAIASVGFASGVLFSDVNNAAWFSSAVGNMTQIGVITGYPDGSFGPGNPISRAEAAVMFDRFKNYVDARVEGKPVPGPLPHPVAVTEPVTVASTNVAATSCAPFSFSQNKQIPVSNVQQLVSAVEQANDEGNVTIVLKKGTYQLSQFLWISGNNVTLRGETGNRDDVIIRGAGMNGNVTHGIQIVSDNVTIADLTIGWVANHLIQIHGENDADNVVIHNVRFADGGEQLLKGSYNANNMSIRSDNGLVECSLFEYTAGMGPQYYIGGIDVHNGKNWIVRNNVFKNIASPEESLAEHAIHFWSSSEGTLVEGNTIINSDRGIGFGMGDRGHIAGIIRNNMIYHNNTRGDAGITLENSPGTKVSNNTIFFENDYPNAIEYRFSGTTNVEITNTISNRIVKGRDGATGLVSGNRSDAVRDWFQNPVIGNLNLKV